MAGISPAWPVFYCWFSRGRQKAGILKINNLPLLQKQLTQNFSNYNVSSSESCQDGSFSEVYLQLLTQSLVRLSRHTHRNVMSRQNAGKLLWPYNTDCLCFPCAACELRHNHTA